ncbi:MULTISPECIES: hypothetical protein [unclassified Brevundimonas]|uniref:hypothetical protein n=1 Tax=unclassified Brevundimonas TaxID=2622653 RepID=UPI0025C2EF64|nr:MULTISPECIES: hypothetical protein [unclassified Brevundimonas]
MADHKLEGPGSAERLERLQRRFRQTSRRWSGAARWQTWQALARTFLAWFAGLALFAVVTLAIADALL